MKYVAIFVCLCFCSPAAGFALETGSAQQTELAQSEPQPLDKYRDVADAFPATGSVSVARTSFDPNQLNTYESNTFIVNMNVTPESLFTSNGEQLTPSGVKLRLSISDAFGETVYRDTRSFGIEQPGDDYSIETFHIRACAFSRGTIITTQFRSLCQDRIAFRMSDNDVTRIFRAVESNRAKVLVEVLAVSFTNGEVFSGRRFKKVRTPIDEYEQVTYLQPGRTHSSGSAASGSSGAFLLWRAHLDWNADFQNGLSFVVLQLMGTSEGDKEVSGVDVDYVIYDGMNERVVSKRIKLAVHSLDGRTVEFIDGFTRRGSIPEEVLSSPEMDGKVSELSGERYDQLCDAVRSSSYQIVPVLKKIYFADGTSAVAQHRRR